MQNHVTKPFNADELPSQLYEMEKHKSDHVKKQTKNKQTKKHPHSQNNIKER